MARIPFHKTKVGIFLIGAILADLLPAPTDFLHFWLQNWLFVNHDVITKGMYVFLQAIDWYIVDTTWFVFLFVLAWLLHIRKKKTISTVTIIAVVISIGAVIGIIAKFLMG